MTSSTIFFLIFYVTNCVAYNKGYSASQISQNPIWNATYIDKLKQDLLLGYDKFARPTQHYNKTTVSLALSILHFEIDEFKSTFNVNAWLRLAWKDEKLQWNTSQYGGLQSANFADHEIWQPDIMLYNGANGAPAANHLVGTHCVVDHSGQILWVPPTQLSGLCAFDLRYWPFDTQKCMLKFGSWTYDGNQIDIQVSNTALDVTDLISNAEWDITSSNATRNEITYACCEEPYVDATFKFYLKRRSSSYSAIIITPALAIIFLTLACFWIPPQSGEKIIVNACTMIIISIFLLYFTQKIPIMGFGTALIILFYRNCMYVVCFSMLEAVLVIWISRTQHENSIPSYIKRPLIGNLGTWLGLNNRIRTMATQSTTNEEMINHEINHESTEFQNQTNDDHHFFKPQFFKQNQKEWVLLATAIDRISFIFCTILFLLFAVIYSI